MRLNIADFKRRINALFKSSFLSAIADIVGGEIAFGSDSAINMASQHINIHNSGVMSGNVTTAGDMNVMPGGGTACR